MISLKIKVVPGARKNRVVGRLGDALKVQVAAPPENGKANLALTETLAAFLGVKASQIVVKSGHTQPHKLVIIYGVTQQRLDDAIAAL